MCYQKQHFVQTNILDHSNAVKKNIVSDTYVLFLTENLVQNFEIFCHFGSYSYLQPYVVTISHLDTWFTLVLLTINILTLFQ